MGKPGQLRWNKPGLGQGCLHCSIHNIQIPQGSEFSRLRAFAVYLHFVTTPTSTKG